MVEIEVKLKVGELKQSEYKPQDKKNEFGRVMAKSRYSLFSIFSLILLGNHFCKKSGILPRVDKFHNPFVAVVVVQPNAEIIQMNI